MAVPLVELFKSFEPFVDDEDELTEQLVSIFSLFNRLCERDEATAKLPLPLALLPPPPGPKSDEFNAIDMGFVAVSVFEINEGIDDESAAVDVDDEGDGDDDDDDAAVVVAVGGGGGGKSKLAVELENVIVEELGGTDDTTGGEAAPDTSPEGTDGTCCGALAEKLLLKPLLLFIFRINCDIYGIYQFMK
jgi:hypothetical protein